MDFLLLVNSTHSNDVLRIEDSCAHCTQRIGMTVDRGQVKEILPAGALVLQGGG
ncbi:MAG: hypothetical protein ACRD96_28650 [Bryobacteraceae bacterium]